jgi:uncharacterized protein involved in response to NO
MSHPYHAVLPVSLATALTAAGNGMMATFVPVGLDMAGADQNAVGTVVTAYALACCSAASSRALLIAIIGGPVVPAFTRNRLKA